MGCNKYTMTDPTTVLPDVTKASMLSKAKSCDLSSILTAIDTAAGAGCTELPWTQAIDAPCVKELKRRAFAVTRVGAIDYISWA